jgi:hypothetical protein
MAESTAKSAKAELTLEYFNHYSLVIETLYASLIRMNLSNEEKKSMFKVKVQRFYAALEQLLRKLEDISRNILSSDKIFSAYDFSKEVLELLSLKISKERPPVISNQSFVFLDRLRNFINEGCVAYDCEFDEKELRLIQDRLKQEFSFVERDLQKICSYIDQLASS